MLTNPPHPAMILKETELSMGVDLIGKGEMVLKDNESGKRKNEQQRKALEAIPARQILHPLRGFRMTMIMCYSNRPSMI
jgi:hypothetical protein